MAEAVFNSLNTKKDRWALSAGVNPADRIQPDTYSVLKEKNISSEGLGPKLVTNKLLSEADMVIAMDDWVADQLEGKAHKVWDIPDPYRNPIDSYRRTIDILIDKVNELFEELDGKEV
jgi:protein-tyrosine-phosphatase